MDRTEGKQQTEAELRRQCALALPRPSLRSQSPALARSLPSFASTHSLLADLSMLGV